MLAGLLGAQPGLELRLKATNFAEGLPVTLEASLVNRGRNVVRLPAPVLYCRNGSAGSIEIVVTFRARGKQGDWYGPGCGEGSGGGVYDALPAGKRIRAWNRIRTWLILAPRQRLSFTLDAREWVVDHGIGLYDVWLVYTPPGLDGEEAGILKQNRLAFPDHELMSNHLVFKR
jgi:hypothetical protein